MAVKGMTQEFMIEFPQIYYNGAKLPANELFQKLMDCMRKHKECYTVTANCSFFLVHIKNRGGLLVSPRNVHRNGWS